MKVVIHAGAVRDDGSFDVTFQWPSAEWGPPSIPRVIEVAPVPESDETRAIIRRAVAR